MSKLIRIRLHRYINLIQNSNILILQLPLVKINLIKTPINICFYLKYIYLYYYIKLRRNSITIKLYKTFELTIYSCIFFFQFKEKLAVGFEYLT